MTTQVIQTKRQPAIWSVKHRKRHKAAFSGMDGRAQAEAYAAENYGEFTVVEKATTGKEAKRAARMTGATE